jgi:sugar phosphate isomerase/epimerase
MKLACQENMAPGATLVEKVAVLEEAGFEGIEIWGSGLWDRIDEIKNATKSSSVSVSSICAGYGGTPLSADPDERAQASADIKRILDAAGELGAVGLIFVPIFGKPQISDLSPWRGAEELERDLLVELMGGWAEHAQKAGTLLLLEPLNRYETHLVKALSDGTDLCERVNNPKGLKIMADFFHMSIEERDIAASIEAAGDWIEHVHLADSTRELPGYGHTDFQSGFAALKKIGFSEYMALECGIPGDDVVAELKTSAQFLNTQIAAAV